MGSYVQRCSNQCWRKLAYPGAWQFCHMIVCISLKTVCQNSQLPSLTLQEASCLIVQVWFHVESVQSVVKEFEDTRAGEVPVSFDWVMLKIQGKHTHPTRPWPWSKRCINRWKRMHRPDQRRKEDQRKIRSPRTARKSEGQHGLLGVSARQHGLFTCFDYARHGSAGADGRRSKKMQISRCFFLFWLQTFVLCRHPKAKISVGQKANTFWKATLLSCL